MSDDPKKNGEEIESTSFEALMGEESEAPEEAASAAPSRPDAPKETPPKEPESTGGTSFEDLGGADLDVPAPPAEEEEEARKSRPRRKPMDDADAAFMEVEPVERKEPEMRAEALGASGGATPPWVTSLFSAILGLVVVGLVWSGLLSIPVVAAIGLLPTAYAVFVGIEGLLSSRPADERLKCFIGLGISLVAILMAASVFLFPSS